MSLPHDPLWPRAASLFPTSISDTADIALVGIPASRTSLSETSAHLSPDAIRSALLRYSTAHSQSSVDLNSLSYWDAGNVTSTDDSEEVAISEISSINSKANLVIALGGDNSITYSGFRASGATSLITIDAHYDLRDGISNGSPVRRLIDEGHVSGKNVVQIGIADFSNSAAYAARALQYGINVIPRSEFRASSPQNIWERALNLTQGSVYVDIDMDVCDRSVVPACPASAPGGISADELRQLAFLAGSSTMVKAIDITEIDAAKDSADERSVRLAALAILEIAAGFSTRN
jgi:arginase family enzyme